MTIADFVRKYLELRAADVSDSTLQIDRSATNLFCEWVPRPSKRRMKSVSPADADDFRAWLKSDRRLSEATASKYCSALRAMFQRAVKRGEIERNPFADVRVTAPERGDVFIPADEDVRALIEHTTDPRWKVFLGLVALAGLRPGEATRAERADVDFDRQRITVRGTRYRSTKRKRREVLLEPELAELIREHVPEGRRMLTTVPARNHDRALKQLLAEAEIEPWEQGLRPLRAWRDTTWRAQGHPDFVVDAWLGHSLAVSREHYTAVRDDQYQSRA